MIIFIEHGIKHDTIFSGKGFHIIAYGEVADDIRCIQEYYTELAKGLSYVRQEQEYRPNRLRRIPNTMNLSTEEGFYCMPVNPKISYDAPFHEQTSFGENNDTMADCEASICI